MLAATIPGRGHSSAIAVEAGVYAPESLGEVVERADALGQLAGLPA